VRQGQCWVVVLAAGSGDRVRHLTRDPCGAPVPKQFFAPEGSRSMLRCTIERAARLVPLSRVVVIVAREHRRWWEAELADLPPDNVVVQPANRGTAAGILLPFLTVLRRDPLATILTLPSDHHVERPEVLDEAVLDAIEAARTDESRIVLLGVPPEEFDREYGWLVPVPPATTGKIARVAAFVEKPAAAIARGLSRRGALVNTLIFAASSAALSRLFESAAPELLARFGDAERSSSASALERLYQTIPAADFSRELLECSPEMLAVLPVARCGWIDLGTPARLQHHRARRDPAADAEPAGSTPRVAPRDVN